MTAGTTSPQATTPAGIPGAQCIDHIALTVPSLDTALDFTIGVLGGELAYRLPPLTRDDDWMRVHLDVHPRASAEIALVRLGPTTNLELFEYRAPDHNPRPPGPADVGSQILGLAVADVDAAAAAIAAASPRAHLGPVRTSPPESSRAGTRWVRVNGPWGIPVELRSNPESAPYQRHTCARRYKATGPWSNHHDGSPSPTRVPGLLGADHIAYTVSDLDAAVAVFTRVLGGEMLCRTAEPLSAGLAEALGVAPGGTAEHAALRMGPTDNVELWHFPDGGGRTDPPRNSDVGGRHLAFHVSDVDAAAAYLAQHPGFAALGEPETIPDGPIAGDRWVYVRSPFGLCLEMVCMPDGSLSYELHSPGRRRAAGGLRWADR